MGKQVEENAVFFADTENHRMLTVILTKCIADAQLPTVRELLAAVGISLDRNQPEYILPGSSSNPFGPFLVWDGGRLPLGDLDRRVVRGERLLWSRKPEL